MSTVESLSFYHDLKGITDEIILTHSGGIDWDIVIECAGKETADQYGSAFVWIGNADVNMIWGCSTYVPYNGSYCELIYSNSRTWLARRERERQAEKTHYIAMAGLHGYLPNSCGSYETYTSAVESLVDLHELSKRLARELRRDGYVELNLAKHGNEYAQISKCQCDDPESHND